MLSVLWKISGNVRILFIWFGKLEWFVLIMFVLVLCVFFGIIFGFGFVIVKIIGFFVMF